MNGDNNSKIITSAQKCLQILKYLAYANEELNINQLAEAMDINKSSMHHYLSTLVVEGFLVQNPQTKKYRIGPEAFKVGEYYLRKDFPYAEMSEILRQLFEQVQESTYFFIRTEDKVTCVLSKESGSKDRMHLEIGTALPLYASASGKIFFAFLTKGERERLYNEIKLEPFTDKTINNFNFLEKEIIEIRLRGYAFSDGEYSRFRELAVPVKGFGDKTIGALTVIGLPEHLTDRNIKTVVKHLVQFGRVMSDTVHNVVL